MYSLNIQFTPIQYNQDKILLKNVRDERLIELSKIEYELLSKYASQGNDTKSLIQEYGQNYELDGSKLADLIKMAKSLGLLIKENPNVSSKVAHNEEWFNMWIFFIYRYLGLSKIGIKLSLSGNWHFYKILVLDLGMPFLEKFFGKVKLLKVSLLVYFFICFTIGTFVFFNSREIPDFFPAVSKIETSILFLLPFVFVVYLVLTLIHEFFHYMALRGLGGGPSEIGIAVVYGFIPIFYTNTNEVVLWQQKLKKLLVTISGVAFDFTTVIICMFILYQITDPYLVVCVYLIFYYQILKIVLNINPFLPGTDGYFILSDIIGSNNLFQTATKEFANLRNGFSANWLLISYFLLACLSIFFSWLIPIISFSFPIWSKFLY